MIKHIISLLLVVSLLVCFGTEVYAETFADRVFYQTYATLQQSKTVNFLIMTNYSVPSIKITNCWLQTKVDGVWGGDQVISAPTDNPSGSLYDVDISYSSVIVNPGTYRIKYIVKADDHSVTRYSSSRTF